MSDPVVPFDLGRLFLGDAPALYYLEIVFRSTLGYLYCFLLIRLLSGRALAQISMTDLVLVIALGSAVGDMAFYADVPILHALVVITVIVLLTKGLDRSMHRWDVAKRLLENVPVVLVEDGVINKHSAARRDMNTLEVMERLRLKGVRNLGEIEWAFLEPDGSVSLFRHDRPKPGLSIVPPHDVDPPINSLQPAGTGEFRCCRTCGDLAQAGDPASKCGNCGSNLWVQPEQQAARRREE